MEGVDKRRGSWQRAALVNGVTVQTLLRGLRDEIDSQILTDSCYNNVAVIVSIALLEKAVAIDPDMDIEDFVETIS